MYKKIQQVVISHKRNNTIKTLTIDGLVSSDQPVIKDHIAGHFKKLLLEPFDWRPRLDGLEFKAIDQTSMIWLEKPFEKVEAQLVVKK